MFFFFFIFNLHQKRSHSFNVHTPLKKEKTQDPPIEHDLYATLEEINKGCVKKMKISRRVLQADGSPKKEDKLVSIAIKPGWKSGTKVTFPKEGDQTRGKIPADIVFIVRDKPHPLYKREGSDLRYTARLTLKQVSSIWWRPSHHRPVIAHKPYHTGRLWHSENRIWQYLGLTISAEAIFILDSILN